MTTKTHLTVTTPEAARVLTSTRGVERLKPFMKGERSLSEAAHELKLELPALLYHVNKFLALGLLEVTRELHRDGRPIKVYRTTAQAFFVPFHLTPSESLERLLLDLLSPSERRFHREAARTFGTFSPVWGLHITCNEEGRIASTLTPSETGYPEGFEEFIFGPKSPAIFVTDGTLRLDFETAKAFQKELFDLFLRYQQKRQTKGQLYAYRLGLTPMQDESLGT